MKKLIISLIVASFLLVGATASVAASLKWDLDEYHAQSDGYTVYFSDGTAEYNKTFPASEAVVDETAGTVTYPNLEENLNLQPGTEYTFTLTRYNSTMESDHSNQVAWTRPAYSPPTDQLPDPVSSAPSGVNGMGVE